MKQIFFFVLSFLIFSSARAETSQLERALTFDEVLVQGKYHFSAKSVTTVTGDEGEDELLGIRKNFKDKIKASKDKH